MSDCKFNEAFKCAMDGISSMADANTVIGEPVTTANGTTIIPVSKLSMGYASGGIDYAGKKAAEKPSVQNNYGGLGGSGLNVSPVAFLIVSPEGNVELLNINEPLGYLDPVSSIVGLIERSPELIEKFKSVFGKNKDTAEFDSEDAE